MTRSEIQGRSR